MRRILIYFDSCILLDSIIFRQGYLKVNSRRKFDIGSIDPVKSEVLLSDINILELTENLKDAMVSEIAIQEGYSYFDLRKDRLEKIKLSETHLKKVDNILKKELVDLPPVSFIQTRGFNAKEVKDLIGICNKYSIFFLDALHFLTAYKSGCHMFVTADKSLRHQLLKVVKVASPENMMRILTPLEFKRMILPNFKLEDFSAHV